MVLNRPDFAMVRPSGLAEQITDAEWWLWLRLHELEPTSQLGGILAWKSGFHSTGEYNRKNHPGNYSIRDAPNKTGPWWQWKASALDWTFPEAHSRNYSRISRYTQRLLASARDRNDPRLDLILYEFFGQADGDTTVEGFNEWRDTDSSSDPSHLWHIHFSFLRKACADFWAMWALLTVLMGWSVAQWRASLPGGTTTSPAQTIGGNIDMYMVQVAGNDSVYVSNGLEYRGIDFNTFRFYVDVMKLPYTMVPDAGQLPLRAGRETNQPVPSTLSADVLARIEEFVTEAIGERGVSAGTLDAEMLRRLVDGEAISPEELAEAIKAAGV